MYILVLPILGVAAGVSIPITYLHRYLERRRETQFTREMKDIGRWILWGDAVSQDTGRGTFIEEYPSIKGPYRLWWTSEDISCVSPYPCCFQELPWEFEDDGFF